jgi:hypothetical protein
MSDLRLWMILDLSLMSISVVILEEIGGKFRNTVRVVCSSHHLISHGLKEDEAQAMQIH